MNKRIIRVLPLISLLSLVACSAKKPNMGKDDVRAALVALDEEKDADVTHHKQVSTVKSSIYQVTYKGHEKDIGVTADYLKGRDTLDVNKAELTKYENNTIVSTATYESYYQNDLKTPYSKIETEDITYINNNDEFVRVSYYGEGNENNSVTIKSKESSTEWGYETWEDYFKDVGYGSIGEVQYNYLYFVYYDGIEVEAQGYKEKDGSFSFEINFERDSTLLDEVSFSQEPKYNPAVKEYFTYKASIDKDGYVTSIEEYDTYYLYGSMIDGKAWKKGIEFYSTSMVNSEYTLDSFENYTGSYHTDIKAE